MRLAIGDLSRMAAVKVPTIRYYEQIGLLVAPPRTLGRQRRYDQAALERLSFIRQARELGLGIEAIRELLELGAEPDRSCADVDRIARTHLEKIEEKIARLTALRREVRRTLNECRQGRIAECRVIEALANPTSSKRGKLIS